MAAPATQDYAAIVAVRNPGNAFETTAVFDLTVQERIRSPYDQFLANTIELNKLWATLALGVEISPDLGNILLLGYVSAVEGYMRALIRGLVNIDQFSKNLCETYQVTYGAVLHHHRNALSDALLEETVFSSGASIGTALKKFVGLDSLSSATKTLTEKYDGICQLRHCCVHRFGKLGAKNATNLGLSEHSKFIEKKVTIRRGDITAIADLLFALVKSVNNEVFGFVLKRSATSKLGNEVGIGWKWNVRSDRKLFAGYYEIFASLEDATPSPPAHEVYEKFRATHRRVRR